MKKKFYKALSVLLCVSLMLSLLSGMSFTLAAGTTVVSDDFSNAVASAAFWQTSVLEAADDSDLVSDYSLEGARLKPAVSGVKNGWLTSGSDTAWPAGRLLAASVTIDLTDAKSYDENPMIVAFYDGENYGGIQLQKSSAGVLMARRAGTASMTGSGTLIAAADNFSAAGSIKVSLAYSYETASKVTVLWTFEGADGQTVSNTYTYAYTGSLPVFKAGFTSGTNGTVYFDDVRLEFERSASEEAQDYLDQYADVLSLTPDTATASDKDRINAANNAYGALSDQVKAVLDAKGVGTLLAGLIDAVNTGDTPEFDGDDFTDAAYTSAVWETKVLNSAASQTAGHIVLTEDSNSFLKPAIMSAAKQAAITTVKDAAWPTATLTAFSVKVKIANNGAWDANPSLIYYYDPATGEFAGMEFSRSTTVGENGERYMAIRPASSSTLTKSGGNILSGTSTDIRVDGWVTISVVYDYTNAAAGQMKITTAVSDEFGNTSNAVTNTYVRNGSTAFPADHFKIGIGSASTTAALVYFDDVQVTFYKSDQDKAGDFKTKYADLLAKTELGEGDEDILTAALNDYNALDEAVKEILRADGVEDKLSSFIQARYEDDINAFRTKYETLLKTEADMATPAIEEQVNAALAELSGFAVELQVALSAEKSHLEALKTAIDEYIEPRADDDFSPFDEDFENGTSKWVLQTEEESDAIFRTIEDPDNPGNHILEMQGVNTIYSVRKAFWPQYGSMTKVTFRIKSASIQPTNPPRAIFSFVDPDNYNSIVFGNNNNACTRGYNDGVSTSSSWNLDIGVNITEWLNVTVTYNGKIAYVIVTDDDDNIFSLSSTSAVNGCFAIGAAASGSTLPCRTLYFDDIHVEFTEGDWDVNEEIHDIRAYYAGNTFISPGETAVISGEKLNDTIKEAYIMRLEDDASGEAGYIREVSYDSIGAYGIETEPVAATWDETKAQKLDIIQRTVDSIKFIIPEDYEKGVYAVRLVPNYASADDVYVYINNPETSFMLGDEGDVSTRGGWLRIIGSNMVPTGVASDVTIRFKSIASGAVTELPVTQIWDSDAYSLKTEIPESMAYGDYEVFVHNGYGDATAWSEPQIITVGPSPRDSWPKQVFNVKDFGAVGDSQVNDTPAVISALEAAAENGGGIVYFPYGTYRVVQTLVIPENVVLQGDGSTYSQIMWTATRWQYGELPETLLAFTRNVEICDIGLHGTRIYNLFTTYTVDTSSRWNEEENCNIYIHDVLAQFFTKEGMITGGGNGGQNTGKLTSGEVSLLVEAEMNNAATIDIDGKNVQIENFKWSTDRQSTNLSNVRNIRAFDSYVRIANCDMSYGWTWANMRYATIFEDNDFGPSACLNLSGQGTYLARNYLHDTQGNNRELFTTDGLPLTVSATLRQIDEYTFEFADTNKYKPNALVGYTVMVTSGQGLGQLRVITANTDKQITVNEPFATAPNRNSLVNIQEPRQNWYFVTNTFYNGGSGGTYGTMLNAVHDGNTFQKHSGQIFNNHASPVWYISVINETLWDPFYMHGEGLGGTAGSQTGTASMQLLFALGNFSYSTLDFLFRNNRMLDGTYITCTWTGQAGNSVRDLIIEGNFVESGAVGISSNDSTFNVVDGFVLKDNNFDGTDVDYTGFMMNNLSNANNMNKAGDKRVILIKNTEESFVLGDVNDDGAVTLKDATLIRNCLVGNCVLTADQLKRADVNQDGTVTLKDATLIRNYLVGNYVIGGDLPTPSDPDTSSGSSGTDSSSTDSSSSESSSTDSSSATSSDEFFEGDW